MSSVDYSVVMTSEVAAVLRRHLLQHIRRGEQQEDLCFALWKPSTGETRTTAVLNEVVLPAANERRLHGGASFLPNYLAGRGETAPRGAEYDVGELAADSRANAALG